VCFYFIQDTYAVARAKAHHQNLFEEIAIRNSQVRLITKTLFFNFYLSKTVVTYDISPRLYSLIGLMMQGRPLS
jgi:hypothetical protein